MRSETNEDILSYLVSSGQVDLETVAQAMKQKRRADAIRNHPYQLYETTDGRWRTYLKDDTKKEGRKAIMAKTKEELEAKLEEFYLRGKTTRTLSSIFDEWQKDKARTRKQATISRDRRTWNKYYAASEIIEKPLADITGRELKVWLEELIKKERLAKHQYVQVKTVIRQMLEYAVEVGYIDSTPLQNVHISTGMLQQERKKPSKTQVYTDEELQRVRKLAWQDLETGRNCVHQIAPLALLFMFVTGLRLGEACAVRWEDIDGNNLWVKRFLSVETATVEDCTKGGFGARSVPLPNEAVEILRAAKAKQEEREAYTPEQYIFSMQKGKPLPYSTLAKLFYRYCRDLGIPPKSSHKARKTYGSKLLRGGVSLESTRLFLGHLHETTTLRSYVYELDEEEKVLEAVNAALCD